MRYSPCRLVAKRMPVCELELASVSVHLHWRMNVSESAGGYQLQRAQAVIPRSMIKPCGQIFFLPAGGFTSFQGFFSRAAGRSLAGDCLSIGAVTVSCTTGVVSSVRTAGVSFTLRGRPTRAIPSLFHAGDLQFAHLTGIHVCPH